MLHSSASQVEAGLKHVWELTEDTIAYKEAV